MSSPGTDIVGATQRLQSIINNITTTLQAKNISTSQRIELQSMLTNAQTALAALLQGQNLSNAQVSDAINKALAAEVFIKDAKGLLNDMYTTNNKNINLLNADETTKMKQVQFNNYFSQKYNYNIAIMKILVLTSVLIMICILLYTRGLLPNFLYVIIISVIVAIAIIVIITMIISELRRSNTDFSNFWWFFNPNTAPS